ncbi:MAG: hypothetical protein A2X64_00900 [Ignavibacteria bacterium GWF2_33_9]|nr:MAG: hypothetical protein A2X64_00900 [Ignavibacteria bacterium GWF2_33_9]
MYQITFKQIIIIGLIFLYINNSLFSYDFQLLDYGINKTPFTNVSFYKGKVAILANDSTLLGNYDRAVVIVLGDSANVLPIEFLNNSETKNILFDGGIQSQIHWDSTGLIWVSGQSMYCYKNENWQEYYIDDEYRENRTFNNFQVDCYSNLWITTSIYNSKTGDEFSELYKFSDGEFKLLLKFPVSISFISRENGNIIAALPDGRVILQRTFQSYEEDPQNKIYDDIYIINQDDTYIRTKLITPSGKDFNEYNKAVYDIIPENSDKIWVTLGYRKYFENEHWTNCCSGISLYSNNKWLPFNEDNGLVKITPNAYLPVYSIFKFEENRYLVYTSNEMYILENDSYLKQIFLG